MINVVPSESEMFNFLFLRDPEATKHYITSMEVTLLGLQKKTTNFNWQEQAGFSLDSCCRRQGFGSGVLFQCCKPFKIRCLILFPALSPSNIFFPEWRKLWNEGRFPHLFGTGIFFFLTLSVQTNIACFLHVFSFYQVIKAHHSSPVAERAVICAAPQKLKFSNACPLFIDLEVKMFNTSNRKRPSLLP